MACEILSGRLTPCKSVGGLKNVYFGAWDSTEDYTVDSGGSVTSFDTALTVFKWELRGANTMDETNEVSRDNGTSFYTSTGTFQFKQQDADTREQLELLSKGNHVVITEGYDGSVKIYGLKDGCDTSVNTVSGSAMGDLNGYNVTVTCLSSVPARFTSLTATGLTISSTTITL